MDFDEIILIPTDDGASLKILGVSLTSFILPDDQILTFTVTGTDGDGDSVMGDINVNIDVVAPAPDAFAAPASFSVLEVADDTGTDPVVQSATAEADTLLGTEGADVFAWSLADNTAAGDLIVGFDLDADAINIADLLGDTTNTADFSSYLDISLAGDGVSTVIRVSNTGDFDNAEQTITVQDVNLVAGVDLDDSVALNAALQSLVDAGTLITD